MHIKELLRHKNNFREKEGLSPISEESFRKELADMAQLNLIVLKNDRVEVFPAKRGK
jgi:hypothetical protein